MKTQRVQVIITEMPESIRAALAADAEARDVSRNEAAVSILAERYGIHRVPSSAPFKPVPVDHSGPITFEVPAKLRSKLKIDAARRGATISGIVRAVLAESYGLPPEEPTRKPRSPVAAS